MRFVPFSRKQLRVLTWWREGSPDCRRDAILCDGAVRSGKTLCLSPLLRDVGDPLLFRHGFCPVRQNHSVAAAQSAGAAAAHSAGIGLPLPLPKRQAAACPWHRANGRTVSTLFGGRDEGSALSVVQGIALAGVLLDEVALMPPLLCGAGTGLAARSQAAATGSTTMRSTPFTGSMGGINQKAERREKLPLSPLHHAG